MKTYSLLSAIVLALGVQSASAQAWKEYRFTEEGFGVQYPGEPKVVERPYSSALASPIVQRVYSYNSGGVDYLVAVADFTGAKPEQDKAINEAADALIARGKLTYNSDQYINSYKGREIRVEMPDGKIYTNWICFIKNKLFQIEVIYPVMNSDPAGSSGIHFFLQTFHLVN
jgi:hypothetical protein